MYSTRHSGRVALTQIIAAALVAGALAAGGAASASAGVGAGAGAPTTDSGGSEPRATSLAVRSSSARAASGADGARAASGGDAASLGRTRTDDFSLVGLTWKPGTAAEDLALEVRTRTGGAWSTWTELHVEDAPADAGTRAGSEPLWVGPSDGVAVRVASATGAAPEGLRVALVDPGELPAASAARTASAARSADGSPTVINRPSMVRRASWGAPRPGSCDSPRRASHTRGVVLHHTAGSNSYSRAQAASVVRSIAIYHMQSQGWCDIGYNFLVDRFGKIYEGRSGGPNRAVRGAHAGNFDVNLYGSGVSMMGNFERRVPSAAMKSAVVRVIGWKLASNYLPAGGRVSYGSKDIARIAAHRGIYLRGIRPATATACPGARAVRWLKSSGGLRRRVVAYIADVSSPIARLRAKVGAKSVGLVRAGEYGVAGGRRTVFTRSVGYWKRGLGASILSGPILARYGKLGDVKSVLGFVATNVKPVPNHGWMTYASFAKGRLYERRGSTFALYGPVYKRYRQLGNANGSLGRPISNVYAISKGRKARFLHGDVRWFRSTGQVVVRYY